MLAFLKTEVDVVRAAELEFTSMMVKTFLVEMSYGFNNFDLGAKSCAVHFD